MSDLDFEAMGRCQHIGKQLESALRDRFTEYSRMTSCFKANGNGQYNNSVTTTDIDKMQKHFEELKVFEKKILDLVTEYNEWAPKANMAIIKLSKY